nr:hypothetical protein [Nanoarchaeota archaeon]
MGERKLRSIVRNVFTKDNLNYLISEGGGAVSGYSLATVVTVFLKDIDFSDELNALFTFTAKSISFWIGNVLTHRIVHHFQRLGPYPKGQSYQLIRSNVQGTGITGVIQLIAHYALLKTSIVPTYLSPLIGYSIPGVFGSAYRHKRNYKQGIISFKRNTDKSKQSIDDLV